MKYIIIKAGYLIDLEDKVNKKIAEGFKPIGSISQIEGQIKTICQAMIKE